MLDPTFSRLLIQKVPDTQGSAVAQPWAARFESLRDRRVIQAKVPRAGQLRDGSANGGANQLIAALVSFSAPPRVHEAAGLPNICLFSPQPVAKLVAGDAASLPASTAP